MRAVTILTAVLLVFVATSQSGCKGCGERIAEKTVEKAIEGASGGKVNVDAGSSVDISGLPEFLRYPGAKAKATWSIKGDEGEGTTYAFETADPRPTVVEFYKKALGGWKNRSTMESEDSAVLMFASADEKEFVTVTIGTEDNKTTIAILLVKNK